MDVREKNYASLRDVLEKAYKRASEGKGEERHAKGLPFEKQSWHDICEHHGIGFVLGQAEKKSIEQYGLPKEQRIDELLDVIVYTSMCIIKLEEEEE